MTTTDTGQALSGEEFPEVAARRDDLVHALGYMPQDNKDHRDRFKRVQSVVLGESLQAQEARIRAEEREAALAELDGAAKQLHERWDYVDIGYSNMPEPSFSLTLGMYPLQSEPPLTDLLPSEPTLSRAILAATNPNSHKEQSADGEGDDRG